MSRVDAAARGSYGDALPWGALPAAGGTDPGVQREVNEDRFHIDQARGVYVVIDGVGGQAAGGKAADVALSMLRERLERETGPVPERIREAVAIANNEIHRLAATRAEWDGMACVLTVAVVLNGKATLGHVGDTRLYKIRENRIEKVTRDHSPVGEREDARELSELQAMRHPRRNEVYRDVGSEPHDASDPDFIDIAEIAFEADSALLLCTDGLTDLVDSSSIVRTVARLAGDPNAVVRALIRAANDAGGTDNVTVVYVEGERFASSQWGEQTAPTRPISSMTDAGEETHAPGPGVPGAGRSTRRTLVRSAIVLLLLAVSGLVLMRDRVDLSWLQAAVVPAPPVIPPGSDVQVVQPTGSIADAIRVAPTGSQIIVEPGEYREQVVLRDRVRLVSRVPRAAIIRLPATTPDAAAVPAVIANGLSGGELVGFRIVGDAATPLGVGISVQDSTVSIVDVEITGATRTAVEFSGRGTASLVGGDIRDNPGAALAVRGGASPRITHTSFVRNGLSERVPGTLVVERGARPLLERNVFVGVNPVSFVNLDEAARLAVRNANWFLPAPRPGAGRPQVPAGTRRQR